jgi:hypothetical protein
VLKVDQALAASWSEREVIERWHALFQGTPQSQSYLAGGRLSEVEQDLLKEQVALWRDRLTSISWLMGRLNEHIARKANEEDQCTGRFWEGRFKSQALLDEAAVLSCMTYVDLNPIRAGLAETPETSDYTSVQRRIEALQAGDAKIDAGAEQIASLPPTQPLHLLPFVGSEREPMPKGTPFHLRDYLELVS